VIDARRFFFATMDTISNDPSGFGLLAIGSSAGWEVAVDETVASGSPWFIQIDGPTIHLRFEIASLAIMRDIANFLGTGDGGHAAQWKEIPIGRIGDAPVVLTRDDEFPDRCFLWIGRRAGVGAQLSIAGKDLAGLAAAARQAADELSS